MPARSHTRARQRAKRSRAVVRADALDHEGTRAARRRLKALRLARIWPYGCCPPPERASRGEVADAVRAHEPHAPIPKN